jgi:hypothetical protein
MKKLKKKNKNKRKKEKKQKKCLKMPVKSLNNCQTKYFGEKGVFLRAIE